MLLAALKLRNKLQPFPFLLRASCIPFPFLCLPFFCCYLSPSPFWLPEPTIRRLPHWPQLLGNLSYAYLAAVARSHSQLLRPLHSRYPLPSPSPSPPALPCLPKRFSILRLALDSLSCCCCCRCASIARSTFLSFAQLFVRAARHFLPHCK